MCAAHASKLSLINDATVVRVISVIDPIGGGAIVAHKAEVEMSKPENATSHKDMNSSLGIPTGVTGQI